MGTLPFISFIICSYNRALYLDDTLQSLIDQKSEQKKIEILVVDNNSRDETPHIIKKYQRRSAENDFLLTYIKETKQGLSHARNRGITEAHAPYVVFLDDDICAAPGLVTAWTTFFTHHPQAVAAGGKIHVQFDTPRPQWMSHFLLPLLGRHDLGNYHKKYPSSKYPFGGNMGFKKSIFDDTGRFDPALGRKGSSLAAGEEKELFNRLRANGADIYYVPGAFLYHRVDAGRLTVDYIKQQALGLGKSMKLHLADASPPQKIKNACTEVTKLLASFPLALAYLMQGQPAKAKLLFQFRRWIWQGYFGE